MERVPRGHSDEARFFIHGAPYVPGCFVADVVPCERTANHNRLLSARVGLRFRQTIAEEPGSPQSTLLLRLLHNIQHASGLARITPAATSTQPNTIFRMSTQLLPLELIDRCVGSRISVIMKGDKGAPLSTSARARPFG